MLSGLPIISAGNLCCCLWVLGGGVLAAYLLQQDQDAPISLGDGALVGLFAGIVGAFVVLVISVPLALLMQPFRRAFTEQILDQAENIPPWARELVMNRTGSALMIAGQFVVSLCAGGIFSTLGGLLGAAIFQKKAPPGTIDIPPVAS